MKVKAILVKAFTSDKTQGNPAGVVVDSDDLNYEQMLDISKQLGSSESVFISKSEKADFKIRFFSIKEEVDLCGHATIAAFYTLVEKGIIDFENKNKKIITQETKAGILQVECDKNGFIFMNQKFPEFHKEEINRNSIAKLLNISENDLGDYSIQSVSTGAHKLIIPIKSLKTLLNIKPDFNGIVSYCKENNTRGFYPFTFETLENGDFHARQFSPLIGINEDPITGVAGGALGYYAVKYNLLSKTDFVIEQGYILNKFGKIYVNITDDIVKVGGNACIYGERNFEV